ncbi:MAG: DUF1294 domain-containing protein [Clostridia bacterium]|nr:DUF1294 domain-containing protein [Clostridia bacterium]
MLPILFYLAVISIASAVLTIKDKRAAIHHQWRVPESVLMFFGLIGGATAMLITMKKIRHKTKLIKFMLGLPIEIVLHIGILVWLFLTIGF